MNAGQCSTLIVDDSKDLREMLKSFLSDEYACIAAGSAEEAIGLLAKGRFSLVITDLIEGRPRDT